MQQLKHRLKKLLAAVLPKRTFEALFSFYHLLWAIVGRIIYRNPSKSLFVIAVTGTKGKSSTTEIIGHLLRAHGAKVATASTIQFSVGDTQERNLHKMTMPGRFFVQKFLRQAVAADCTHAIIEMTSEGAKQSRHKFIELDALVFTNLSPEHIESHGSFEKYKAAKLTLAQAVSDSPKPNRYIVANADDDHGADFLDFAVEHPLPYSLEDLTLHTLQKDSVSLVIDDVTIRVPIVGLFNVYNTLAAITMVRALGMPLTAIRDALRELPTIKGRVEMFVSPDTATKKITAVVDYAHTPDSLEKLYGAFADQPKVCVLGNTGGGRDTWKRPEMAAIAEKYCDQIIFTNEDPYDENPQKIIGDMEKGIEDKEKLHIIMDRKEAIRHAITIAPEGAAVIVSGKGTDPYIMGPHGTKQPWSDAQVVQEELASVLTQQLETPESAASEAIHHS